MTFKTKKTDESNYTISATISATTIDTNIDKVAKQASKTMDIQGFRKGKVPTNVVKQRYGDKLKQDAHGEAIRELISKALKDLKIENKDLVSEPDITKFDENKDNSLELQIDISTRPNIKLDDYKSYIPKMTKPKITEKEVDEQLQEIAKQSASLEKIARKRMVKKGDFAVIDFEGFKDGVAFDGGSAKNHTLEIGSNSFIPGFEDQVIGMKYDETKDISVTFPKEYQAKDLAGQDVVFKVTLHEIQEKKAPELTDEWAATILPNEKDVTLDSLKNKLKEQIQNQKKDKYFNDDIKPKYIESLIKNISFDVPQSLVKQEINAILDNKARTMSEDEIKNLRDNPDELTKLQDSFKPQAIKNVKSTFFIDTLAKEEKIEISDQEVSQTIYYEAMMNGQDGTATMKQYEEAGYLPMIKMSIIESKVITQIFNEALDNQGKK